MPVAFVDAATRTSDRESGLYQRFVLRGLSLPVSRVFLAAGFTANQTTALALLTGLAAAGTAVVGTPSAFLAAAVLLHAAKILDFVDGNLARARGEKTWAGKFFDGLSDVAVDVCFMVGLSAGLGGGWVVFGALAALGHTFGHYAQARYAYIHACMTAPGFGIRSSPTAAPPPRSGVRRVVPVMKRIGREIELPGLIAAVVAGRPEWWLAGMGSFRILVAGLQALRAMYAGAVSLNVPRR